MRTFFFLLILPLIGLSCKKEKCSKSEVLFIINTENSDYEKSGHIFLTNEKGNYISSTPISENKLIYEIECEEKHIPGKINLHFISRDADDDVEINISSFLNIQSGNYDAEFNFYPFQPRGEYGNYQLKWDGDTTNMEFIYCTKNSGFYNPGHLEKFDETFDIRMIEGSPTFVGVKYFGIDTLYAGLIELNNTGITTINESNLSHSFFLRYGNTLPSNPILGGRVSGTFECSDVSNSYHLLGVFEDTKFGPNEYTLLSFDPQDIFPKYKTSFFHSSSSPTTTTTSIQGWYYISKLLPANFSNEISFFDCAIDEKNQVILDEANPSKNREIYEIIVSTNDDKSEINVIGDNEELSNYELPELPKEIKSEYPEFSHTNPKKEKIIRYATEMPIGLQGFYNLALKTNRSKNECDYFDIAGKFSTKYENKN